MSEDSLTYLFVKEHMDITIFVMTAFSGVLTVLYALARISVWWGEFVKEFRLLGEEVEKGFNENNRTHEKICDIVSAHGERLSQLEVGCKFHGGSNE